MKSLPKLVVPLVVVILVVAGVIVLASGGSKQKTLTAYFPTSVSLYVGSDVRVLGVPVGKVDSVTPEITPQGDGVKVVMHYDADVKVPADAQADIISPAIVGDRYIELTPAYPGSGAVLADNTVFKLGSNRTNVPVELDQIFGSIDNLTVALGPDGANSKGALSDLLAVTAKNFGGEGEQFHNTLHNFAQLSTTLDDNKSALFSSARSLQTFITKLADNDSTVRKFNSSLAQVSTVLSGDRYDLANALRNLATGLDSVGSFVHRNRAELSRNIDGLNRVAKVLVKERKNLDETLRVAPLALNNLGLTYNPDAGTLDTNANAGMLADQILKTPKQFLCALVSSNDKSGNLCKLVQSLPLPRTAPFGAGTGSFYGHAFDPTLGGLVEGSAS